MKELDPSVKHHLVVGLLIGLWIFVFAFIIRPFDDGTLSFRSWLLMSLGFSVFAFLSYSILALVQKKIYQYGVKWSIGLEIGSVVFFYILYLVSVYTYYKGPVLNGGYSFYEFCIFIFLKVVLILTPLILLSRRYLVKQLPPLTDVITIRGAHKLDVLKINKDDLVCVSNAQNYVELFYIENEKLRSKLIRSSLKKVQRDFDFLVQIHRSHLINPSHFKSWRNQNVVLLTQMELPVSKTYKSALLAL